MTSTAAILAPQLAKAVAAQQDRLDLDLLARANQFSARAHRGQKRQSGDDFVSHSVAVATILAEQQMDSTTIAAALLHDVVEDAGVTVDDIRREFGSEVADLVDGLTKLSSGFTTCAPSSTSTRRSSGGSRWRRGRSTPPWRTVSAWRG